MRLILINQPLLLFSRTNRFLSSFWLESAILWKHIARDSA